MDKELQQKYCKICVNRQLNIDYNGFICSLTKSPGEFTNECPSFKQDNEAVKDFGALKKRREQIESEEKTGGLHKIGIKNGFIAGTVFVLIGFILTIITLTLGFISWLTLIPIAIGVSLFIKNILKIGNNS